MSSVYKALCTFRLTLCQDGGVVLFLYWLYYLGDLCWCCSRESFVLLVLLMLFSLFFSIDFAY